MNRYGEKAALLASIGVDASSVEQACAHTGGHATRLAPLVRSGATCRKPWVKKADGSLSNTQTFD
jgi:hypothetical protein